MKTPFILADDLSAVPRVSEIYRLLGGREEDASERMQAMVDEAMLIGHNLSEPRALYGFFNRIEDDTFLINDDGPIVLGICTIGAALEEEVRKLTRESRFALATTLDAVASETVEALAEALDARICEQAADENLAALPRFSPGYGDWPLERGQKTIFSYLPAEKIGVQLSPTSLMNPLKSISFAMKLSTSAKERPQILKCGGCDKENCLYRR